MLVSGPVMKILTPKENLTPLLSSSIHQFFLINLLTVLSAKFQKIIVSATPSGKVAKPPIGGAGTRACLTFVLRIKE